MSREKMKAKKAKAKERATEEEKYKKRLFAIRKKRSARATAKLERQHRERIEPAHKTHMEKISDAVEHNLEMLKALEEEYVIAQQSKDNLDEELAAEGYNSLEEKINAMKEKAVEIVDKVQAEADEKAEVDENKQAAKKRNQI